MKMPIRIAPTIAARKNPAPSTMPSAIDQNMKTVSIGSLIAVRKRTMDSAPTMPSESLRLFDMIRMTSVATIVSMTRLILKVLL